MKNVSFLKTASLTGTNLRNFCSSAFAANKNFMNLLKTTLFIVGRLEQQFKAYG